MSLGLIVARRRDALIKAWVRNPLVQVQAESPHHLAGLVFIDDPDTTAVAGTLGRRKSQNVAVVEGSGDPDANASVWVAASYKHYKAAYIAFVNRVYAVKAAGFDLAGYDVDHLLNRARSPSDLSLIRIEAVPSAANQAWGRLFEYAASHPSFYANQYRGRRTMSWMICAKLAGQMPPTGPEDVTGITRLVTYFESLGIPAAEARDGIASMLQFAYRFR